MVTSVFDWSKDVEAAKVFAPACSAKTCRN